MNPSARPGTGYQLTNNRTCWPNTTTSHGRIFYSPTWRTGFYSPSNKQVSTFLQSINYQFLWLQFPSSVSLKILHLCRTALGLELYKKVLRFMIRAVHPWSGSWLLTHPGSRGQRATGSRILNTSYTKFVKTLKRHKIFYSSLDLVTLTLNSH
jgi:hypothetical protein